MVSLAYWFDSTARGFTGYLSVIIGDLSVIIG
jgi:hypothetical protein